MNIGQQIKEHRLRKNVTRQELAEATGLSRVTIANIERDTFTPLFTNAIKIAKYLKISLDDLAKELQEPADKR